MINLETKYTTLLHLEPIIAPFMQCLTSKRQLDMSLNVPFCCISLSVLLKQLKNEGWWDIWTEIIFFFFLPEGVSQCNHKSGWATDATAIYKIAVVQTANWAHCLLSFQEFSFRFQRLEFELGVFSIEEKGPYIPQIHRDEQKLGAVTVCCLLESCHHSEFPSLVPSNL